MNWFLFGVCAAVLYSSTNGRDWLSSKIDAIKCLDAIRKLYLLNRTSEIQHLENILVYPVVLAPEVEIEYAYRERIGAPDIAKLGQAIHMEPGVPGSLRSFYSDFTEIAKPYFSRRDAYYPDKFEHMFDRDHFAYIYFAIWLNTHPDREAAARAILFPPFLTMATLRINKLLSEPFKWRQKIIFFSSYKTSTEVVVLRNIGTYEYAEFSYEETCQAAALRLKVNHQLSMIFVIPLKYTGKWCNSAENLKLLADKHFGTITFKPQRMFVSIPIIRTASILYTAKHLEKLGLIRHTPYEFAGTSSPSDRYLSMALIFDPEVSPNEPIPRRIPTDIGRFQAEQPFLVAVLGENGSRVPFVLGLIQNPVTVS